MSLRTEDLRSVWLEFEELSQNFDAVSLGHGTPSFEPPSFLAKELEVEINKSQNHQYFRTQGLPALAESISKYYSSRFHRGIDPLKEVMVSCGANGCLNSFFQGLTLPGDEIVVIEPCFPVYYELLSLAQLKVRTTQLTFKEGNWDLDFDSFKSCFNDRTKLLLLNNPQNPTGKCFSRQELKQISDFLNRYYPSVKVICDEVYDFLVPKDFDFVHFALMDNNWEKSVSIFSGGKLFNATGWRIGWAIGPENIIKQGSLISHIQYNAFNKLGQAAFAQSLPKLDEIYAKTSKGQEYTYTQYISSEMEAVKKVVIDGLNACDLKIKPLQCQVGYFLLADISSATTWLPSKYIDSHEYDADLPEKLTKNRLYTKDGKVPLDLAVCRYLAIERGIVAMPCTLFYHKDSSNINHNLIRIALCKSMEITKDAMNKLNQKGSKSCLSDGMDKISVNFSMLAQNFEDVKKFGTNNFVNNIEPIYQEVASKYEVILEQTMGYKGHFLIARAVEELGLEKEAIILDVACGTGLVGRELNKIGYENLIGIDASAEMIEEAKMKNVYRQLIIDFVHGSTFDFDEELDVITICGAIIVGHLPHGTFDLMFQGLRVGGYVIVTIRPENCLGKFGDQSMDNEYLEKQYEELAELERRGICKTVISETFPCYSELKESIGFFKPFDQNLLVIQKIKEYPNQLSIHEAKQAIVGVQMKNLTPNKPNLEWVTQNSDLLKGFASFPTTDEIGRHYDNFAQQYDELVTQCASNDISKLVAYIEKENLPRDLRICDFGCGTGIIGVLLKNLGFENIDGIDASEGMIEVCRKTHAYNNLYVNCIGEDQFPSELVNQYDLVVSSGCFIKNHFPSIVFLHMYQALVPGGKLIFSMRDVYWNDANEMQYKPGLERFMRDDSLKIIDEIRFLKYEGMKGDQAYPSLEEETATIRIMEKSLHKILLIQGEEAPIQEKIQALEKFNGSCSLEVRSNFSIEDIENYDGIILYRTPFGNTIYNECNKYKKNSTRLRWVAMLGAGVDSLLKSHDKIKSTKEENLFITCSRGASKTQLSEFVVAAFLYFTTNMEKFVQHQRVHEWKPVLHSLMKGKTVLIAGLGENGKELARILKKGFDMKVIGISKSAKPYAFADVNLPLESLNEVLPQADYVLNTLPLTHLTKHTFTSEQFKLMKSEAFFGNIGRGATVKEDDLLLALQNKTIKGAFLDVFEKEPLSKESPFYELDNVLITSHSADLTPDYFDGLIGRFEVSLNEFIEGRKFSDLVNAEFGY